jgi:hypothetical protein
LTFGPGGTACILHSVAACAGATVTAAPIVAASVTARMPSLLMVNGAS